VLAEDLARQRVPFVVIDQDAGRTTEAGQRNFLFLEADATADETLIAAGIQRARALVTCLPNDAANVFITLTGRNLNAKIQIIARAEHRSSERKLLQAGANRVVMPAANGARRMARLVTRPSTADVVELVTESDNLDFVLDELFVSATCGLVGRTVAETQANRKHRLLVVAVKEASGAMLFNPDGDYRFDTGQIVILMGRNEDLQNFRAEYQI
jgi:voltage-gated potassium channel